MTTLVPSLSQSARADCGWGRVLAQCVSESSATSFGLERELELGWIARDVDPHYFVYRLTSSSQTVHGLLALVDLVDLESLPFRGETGQHATCPRCQLFMNSGVQLDPIIVRYDDAESFPAAMDLALGERPLAHFIGSEQITHTCWSVTNSAQLEKSFHSAVAREVLAGNALISASHSIQPPRQRVLAMLVHSSFVRDSDPADLRCCGGIPWPRSGLVAFGE